MAMTETSQGDVVPEEPQAPPEEAAPPAPSVGSGAAGNDHKIVGSEYLVMAVLFLVIGGVLALLMRAQLASPDADLLSNREYRTLFTFHGTFMVFLFLVPAWLGVATAIVPLQIGAARLAFPRLQVLAMWLTFSGGALMVASALATGGRRLTSGFALSDPIPEGPAFRGEAVEFLVIGVAFVLAGAVLASGNLLTTIVKFRAPGLTMRRLPVFTWSLVVSGVVMLLAAPVLMAAMGMLYVDHHFGAQLFSGFTSSGGGSPLLWPRLFWFGAYPLLFALLLPALGTASEIIPVFARRPIADYAKAVAALGAAGVLAFAGWGSEVENLGEARWLFALGALAVLAPVASLVLNWLLTLQKADREDLRAALRATPVLHVLGFVVVLAAGLAVSAVSAVDATGDLHANYWQVGQQHLLFFAPATLGFVAAIHFWGPKWWGRHLSGGLGKLEVLLLTGGSLLSFLPALILGLQDMPVRTSSYPGEDEWQAMNLAMGLGSVVLVLGVLAFVLNLLFSVVLRRGKRADADPWEGHTLEWAAPSPPPRHNFDRVPEVRSSTPLLDLRATEPEPEPAA
ncbi:MAG: cytochrome c oxidase subunit I [Acidimicrobiales bacterium]